MYAFAASLSLHDEAHDLFVGLPTLEASRAVMMSFNPSSLSCR